MRSAAHSRGFTLIELLVAITILALLAVFSWRGLDQVVRTRDALGQSQASLDALQRVFNRLARDASLARTIQVGENGSLGLTLSAVTSANSAPQAGQEVAQSAVVVEYGLDADKLVRRDALVSAADILLDKVEAWGAEVRRSDGSWGASVEGAPMPSGLRVSLRIKDLGEVRRVFLVHE